MPNGIEHKIPLPAQLIHQLGLTKDSYFIFTASFVPEKDPHFLIEAFKKPQTDKKLVMAGDGAYGDSHSEGLKSNACDNIISPDFFQDDLFEELLNNAYLYVLPFEIEGHSFGLLEATTYGKSVLDSDVEEYLEVIGSSGLTFQTRNTDFY